MSSTPYPLYAGELPFPEVRRRADAGAVALLPVGSTEAHGPHLPLSVDVVIAEGVCARVADALRGRGEQVVIFPAVPYGLTEFARKFAGTVSLPESATFELLTGVLTGIAEHGFSRILVCNHHVEPAHFRVVHRAAKAAAERTSARIRVPDHRREPFAPRLGREFTHGGSHAGLYETSLVLALRPDLVDEAARRALPDLEVDLPSAIKAGAKDFHEAGGPEAYFGAPARATAEEGERLLAVLVENALAALDS